MLVEKSEMFLSEYLSSEYTTPNSNTTMHISVMSGVKLRDLS